MSNNLKTRGVSESVNRAASQIAESAESMTENVSECIAEHPLSSVLVATGAGIGVGLLMTALFSSEPTRREKMSNQLATLLRSGVNSVRSGVDQIIPDSLMNRFSR